MKMLHIYAIKLIFWGQKYENATYLCNKVDILVVFEVTRATQSHPEPPRATQSHPEPPRATQSHPEPPRATQSHPEPPRASQSLPEPPRASQSHPEPPRATQSHPEPPRATQSRVTACICSIGFKRLWVFASAATCRGQVDQRCLQRGSRG